jgi:transcriptional regulator with XRE-family HTH domain
VSTPPTTRETLGQRIARLRTQAHWTQQELADRVAISRVAISHLEMGISVPSERTVALLAGAFHVEPSELVDETSYPVAKAERLPLVAARYTEVELQVALMRRDLEWAERFAREPDVRCLSAEVRQTWLCRLGNLSTTVADPRERRLLADAGTELSR